MKRVGNFLLSLTPMIVCLVMQFGCGIVFSIVATFVKMIGLRQQGITDMMVIQSQTEAFMEENLIWAVVMYHILGLIVFSLWYYFGCGKPKPAKVTSVLTPKTVIGTVILGIGIEFFVCTGVYLVGLILPDLIQSFEEAMQNMGVSENSVPCIIATVILAPVGEEILCRGLILHYAKKVSKRFIIANTIQALAFGIMHMQLVQGTYAFIMGLVLGVLYERFHSLYLCMLAHFVINFSASFIVDPVMKPIPESVAAVAAVMLVSLAVWIAGLKIVGKPVKTEELPMENTYSL